MGPAPQRAHGRPWPWRHGSLCPRRSRSTWCDRPVSALTYGVAAAPWGMAPFWRSRASQRGSLKRSPPRPGDGGWTRRHSNLGDSWSSGILSRPDAAVSATVAGRIDLYMRPCRQEAVLLSVAEPTTLPLRHWRSPTRPAPLQTRPTRPERVYRRAGVLTLGSAFDTLSGTLSGHRAERQPQREYIAFLEGLDTEHRGTIHLVGDTVTTPHGNDVRMGLAPHPRLIVPFTPVQVSGRHPGAQGFSLAHASACASSRLTPKTACGGRASRASIHGIKWRIRGLGLRRPWPT
jgi:hypothetical protein